MAWPVSGFVGLTVAGVEVAGNGYSRQETIFTPASDDTYATNSEPILWPPAAPIGWGTIATVVLYDASGEVICVAPPVHTVTVDAYDSVRIRPAGFVLTNGPPVGTRYGRHLYGMGHYATQPSFLGWVDLIEVGFDKIDPCTPGVWVAEACHAGAWAQVDLCTEGTWGPAQKPLRRAA